MLASSRVRLPNSCCIDHVVNLAAKKDSFCFDAFPCRYGHRNPEAETQIYSLNTVDGDGECNFKTRNIASTPTQLTNTTPGAFRKQPFR